MLDQPQHTVYHHGSAKGATVRDNPVEIADHLVREHGFDGAMSAVDEGKTKASSEGDNYRLSVWREVRVALQNRVENDGSNKGG